jgi:hypothetical protein
MLLLYYALQHSVNPDMNAVLIFMPINSFHYWRLLYSGVWHHVVWCVDTSVQEKPRRWRHQVVLKWWYQYTSLCGMIFQMVFIFICPTLRTWDLAHLSLLLQMSSCREISVVWYSSMQPSRWLWQPEQLFNLHNILQKSQCHVTSP